MYSLPQALVPNSSATAFLLTTVIGSSVTGERLAGGNVAIALLGNTTRRKPFCSSSSRR
jgi:hypothetical protein